MTSTPILPGKKTGRRKERRKDKGLQFVGLEFRSFRFKRNLRSTMELLVCAVTVLVMVFLSWYVRNVKKELHVARLLPQQTKITPKTESKPSAIKKEPQTVSSTPATPEISATDDPIAKQIQEADDQLSKYENRFAEMKDAEILRGGSKKLAREASSLKDQLDTLRKIGVDEDQAKLVSNLLKRFNQLVAAIPERTNKVFLEYNKSKGNITATYTPGALERAQSAPAGLTTTANKTAALLSWAKSQTAGYAGVEISNFTTRFVKH